MPPIICVTASSGSCRPILFVATIKTPAIVAMAFLLVRISPVSFHIRTPHDEANAQSCARFSQECILNTSGADIMPGTRPDVNAKSAIGYFYRCSLPRSLLISLTALSAASSAVGPTQCVIGQRHQQSQPVLNAPRSLDSLLSVL